MSENSLEIIIEETGLESLFQNLKLDSKESNNLIKLTHLDNSIMTDNQTPSAPPQQKAILDKSEIQLLIHAIPEYHPGDNLSIFINEVDNLIDHLTNRLTPDLEYILNFNIRSKIKAEARDFLAFQNIISWADIRLSLLRKYGDQRSEELLVSALKQSVQYKNETYNDFYTKILKTFSDLMQYISLNCNDKNLFLYKKFEYTNLALKTFQIGLLEPYRSYLSHFELTTIEECLNKCNFYDNRKQEWEYCEFIRKSNDPLRKSFKTLTAPNSNKFSYQNHTKSFHNNQPQTSHFKTSNFYPNFTNKYENNPQLAIQPKPFKGPINEPLSQNSRILTNKQVFGSDNPHTSVSKRYVPTPMSVQSKNPTQRFSSKFPSKTELFNIEFPEDIQEDEPQEYQDEYYSEDNNHSEDFHEDASEEI